MNSLNSGIWLKSMTKSEKQTIELAEGALKTTNYPLVGYLIEYMLTDERKHNQLLEEMERIKKGMYPYGG